MITVKLDSKSGENWIAKGLYISKKKQIELPATFVLKPSDKGLEVVLNSEVPCTIDHKEVLSFSPQEAYPIPYKGKLKKGFTVEIATENISHLNIKKS